MTELAPRDTEPTGSLRIQRDCDEHGVVLVLGGELDLGSAPELEQQLSEIQTEKPDRILVDLSAVSFMDSTGLAVMLRAQQTAQANGHQLCLRPGSRQVQRLFEITGVLERFMFQD
jgi:anti-sigma B factor antagonist